MKNFFEKHRIGIFLLLLFVCAWILVFLFFSVREKVAEKKIMMEHVGMHTLIPEKAKKIVSEFEITEKKYNALALEYIFSQDDEINIEDFTKSVGEVEKSIDDFLEVVDYHDKNFKYYDAGLGTTDAHEGVKADIVAQIAKIKSEHAIFLSLNEEFWKLLEARDRERFSDFFSRRMMPFLSEFKILLSRLEENQLWEEKYHTDQLYEIWVKFNTNFILTFSLALLTFFLLSGILFWGFSGFFRNFFVWKFIKRNTTGIPFLIWSFYGLAMALFVFFFRGYSEIDFKSIVYVMLVAMLWFVLSDLSKKKNVFNENLAFVVDGIFYIGSFCSIFYFTGGLDGKLYFIFFLVSISAPIFSGIIKTFTLLFCTSIAIIATEFLIVSKEGVNYSLYEYDLGVIVLMSVLFFVISGMIIFFKNGYAIELKKNQNYQNKLKKINDSIELAIREKTERLEKISDMMVKREGKLFQLKSENEELRRKIKMLIAKI